eukprot:TRINITY_DN644_c0_g1_i1.p1 TRINITY_DN644_c0_g1~~TRINITY_DN644_c0_g1_i1.p1  ORF type:complete len:376 (+),score=113.88 TRINITY_DN644_c0_g1_i1:238-1365(+)
MMTDEVSSKLPESVSHAIYQGPGNGMKFEAGLPMPKILQPTDVIVKVLKTTICGTDLHILRGNVSTCAEKRRIGHEGIGEIIEVGRDVKERTVGQRVLVSCITACGKCVECEEKFYGHCENGGWLLGNEIDGMQGTFARIPHADYSTYIVPPQVWNTDVEDGLVMCSDILPTGLELGLLDGGIKPGMTIAIVGVGPVGLAALVSTSMFTPKALFVIDTNDHRLEVCQQLGKLPGLENTQIHLIDNKNGDAVEQVMKLTNNRGVDLVIEAIGIPAGWYICQDIVRAGGHIAMLGVHGKPATIALEKMWFRNFRLTAGVMHGYTIAGIMEKVIQGEVNPNCLISHKMPMSQMEKAYDMFQHAGMHKALKILIVNDIC